MHKSTARHRHSRNHAEEYDIYNDLLKIRDAFSDTAKDVKGRAAQAISESFDTVKERSTELQDGVANYTREQPIKTVGFAMLAGIVIGYWLHK